MKTGLKALLFVIVVALVACKSEPKVVDEASVQANVNSYITGNAANLLEPERLTPMVLKTYGVPEHEQPRFLEIYQRFLKYRAMLPQELQRADQALRLTLELSLDDPGDRLLAIDAPAQASADDPAYLAYLMHLAGEVESKLAAEPGYIARLAGLYQVEPRQAQRALWIAFQQDLDGLANAVVGLMESELGKGLDADAFAERVLAPFLTYVSRGFTLNEENEKAMVAAVDKHTGLGKDFEKAFVELRYHLNGEEPGVPKLHALNRALREKKLFIHLLPGKVTLQRPTDHHVEIGAKALGGIHAVAGAGLALRRPGLGCWAYADRELALPVDNLAAQRDLARALAVHGSLPRPIDDPVLRLWKDQAVDRERDQAIKIYQDLAKQAVDGAEDDALLADLYFDAALLQARCRTELDGKDWDRADQAVAAYSAQIVLGKRPELGLIDLIELLQRERIASRAIDRNDRMDAVLAQLWKLAGERSAGTLDRAGLQSAVRGLHDAHTRIKGGKGLPALDGFENEIVKAKLASAPALSI